ncbi:S8 family serine peptidase [Kineobactrum salinum]|uniref:S8 family serine peptidase n=1 Tax=Kineobactrum salinum TaxID=2708301 RepID=A0A6C0U1F4_9GAMM|nr:S8 family serine peptidase [Kineobactrum salinum]QIB65940.1 S8 family serine peptidase [Kineobactrum salinum]
MAIKTMTLAAAVSVAVAGLVGNATAVGQTENGTADRMMQQRAADQVPAHLTQRKLDTAITTERRARQPVDAALRGASGRQQVIVRLQEEPVARMRDKSAASRKSYKQKVKDEQKKFIDRASKAAPGGRVIAQTQVVVNAVFMEVDAADIEQLARDPDVFSINRVKNYEQHLAETVPYVGAAAVQQLGVDGSNIRVAVLDSGIDYTHAALGGEGTLEAYEAAWGTDIDDPANTSRDGLFPTAKVVEGHDFVGELWPTFGDLAPDDDPIDFDGHGSHVADIIAGVNGMAPGAELYAVKVCSAVATSCSGIALIQAIEYAADPNGDGDLSDAVDIINMSLGSNYGQPFDDDLAAAVDNASALGILTVASAGNGGNKPYVNGTPAAAPTALSVAQTQVPSAIQPFLTLNGVDYPAVFQPWSQEPTGVISGELQYGDGAGGNLEGCDPFAPDSLAGLVVLIDRGACNFTLKVKNVGDAGGIVGIIGLVDSSDPFVGGDGGDRPIDIPGYMISQANANIFKASVGDEVTVDPAKGVPLVGQMVGSSSRGPQHESTTLIKPEIGAPGASVSAIAGSGADTGPFGGTSGAAPMVSGAAALLMQSEPGLTPAEVKARLMNTGETDIDTDPVSGLAPISRIGGGELRVDRAYNSPVSAWDAATLQGALSFGFIDVDKSVVTLNRTVNVRNYSNQARTYSVASEFRYANDAATDAVAVELSSSSIEVDAGQTGSVNVKLTIHGDRLPGNAMNSGSEGANPAPLTLNEYDGYLVFDDGMDPIQVPWHVLPRKAANVKGRQVLTFKDGIDEIRVNNIGMGTAQNDAYSLIALSDDLPSGGVGEQSPTPDLRAVGVNTIPVPAGFCSAEASFLWTFAINTWERQQHLLPVSHQVLLDTDRDGEVDYIVLNRDLSGLDTITDGRQLSWVVDNETGDASAFFFAEHATNTANTVLTICAEQIGMSDSDLLATPVDVSVLAQDFYFGGPGDEVTGLTITPLGERYFAEPVDISGRGRGVLTVYDFGEFVGNTPEHGVMLFTNGDRGAGARAAPPPTPRHCCSRPSRLRVADLSSPASGRGRFPVH